MTATSETTDRLVGGKAGDFWLCSYGWWGSRSGAAMIEALACRDVRWALGAPRDDSRDSGSHLIYPENGEADCRERADVGEADVLTRSRVARGRLPEPT